MERNGRTDDSPVSSVIKFMFVLASFCTFIRWLQFFSPLFRPRWTLKKTEIDSAEFTGKRALAVELYLIAWYVLQAGIWLILALYRAAAPQWLLTLGAVLAVSRILEVMQITLGVVVFDYEKGRIDNRVASANRTFILTFINFGELIACFGLVYASQLRWLNNASSYIDALYFSGITQLTIGYGDIQPLGPWKLLAVAQGISGFLFAVVVIARVLTILPPMGVRLGTPGSGCDEDKS